MNKIKLLLLLPVLLILMGCKKDYPKEVTDNKSEGNKNSAAVLATTYTDHIGKDLYFDLDICLFHGPNSEFDNLTMDTAAFGDQSYSSLGMNLHITGVEKIALQTTLNYANMFLINLSRTSHNLGIMESLNKALREAAASNCQTAIATYSGISDDNLYKTHVWNGGTPFTQSYEDLAKILVTLNSQQATGSRVYDALNVLIDSMKYMTNAENKYITIVDRTYDLNKNNQYNYKEIAEKALKEGIKINVLAGTGDLYFLSSITGGFNNNDFYSPYNIHRMLSRQVHIYRLHCKMTRVGNWVSNHVFSGYYKLTNQYTDQSLPLYVRIP